MAIDAKTTVIPQAVLDKMSQEDRARFGRAGMTTAECDEKQAREAEKVLQRETRAYLDLHQIEFIQQDMRKKSTLPTGWPDFTFTYRGVPIGAEAKVFGKKAEPNQVERHEKMRANGWMVIVYYSVADIQALMRQIDSKRDGWIFLRDHSCYVSKEQAIRNDPGKRTDPTHMREVIE